MGNPTPFIWFPSTEYNRDRISLHLQHRCRRQVLKSETTCGGRLPLPFAALLPRESDGCLAGKRLRQRNRSCMDINNSDLLLAGLGLFIGFITTSPLELRHHRLLHMEKW